MGLKSSEPHCSRSREKISCRLAASSGLDFPEGLEHSKRSVASETNSLENVAW
jgi:hypothetical protein